MEETNQDSKCYGLSLILPILYSLLANKSYDYLSSLAF